MLVWSKNNNHDQKYSQQIYKDDDHGRNQPSVQGAIWFLLSSYWLHGCIDSILQALILFYF